MPPKDPMHLRINEILDEMSGKHIVHQVYMRLKTEGLIPPVDEYEYGIAFARKKIEEHGQGRQKEGEITQRFLNLTEVNSEGETEHYYKKVKELTAVESAQALAIENRNFRRQGRKFWQLYDAVVEIHGQRKIQGLLKFRLPERAAEEVT